MSTYMAKPSEVSRKWYILDAKDKPLGRVASVAATLLRGKHKPTFTPNVDCRDHVIIVNVEKAILTGKKMDQKMYRHHTGFIGGLKEEKYSTLMNRKPELAMELAVKGMIPDNTLGRAAFRRLRVYQGDAHKHAAQNPENWSL